MGNTLGNKEVDMITTNAKTVILGVIILVIGIMTAVGIVEELVEKFRKDKQEKQQKKKNREMYLRAGELAMLDGLILLMKGLLVSFENHVFVLAVLSWLVVACFDILYVTVSRKVKKKRGYRES